MKRLLIALPILFAFGCAERTPPAAPVRPRVSTMPPQAATRPLQPAQTTPAPVTPSTPVHNPAWDEYQKRYLTPPPAPPVQETIAPQTTPGVNPQELERRLSAAESQLRQEHRERVSEQRRRDVAADNLRRTIIMRNAMRRRTFGNNIP